MHGCLSSFLIARISGRLVDWSGDEWPSVLQEAVATAVDACKWGRLDFAPDKATPAESDFRVRYVMYIALPSFVEDKMA